MGTKYEWFVRRRNYDQEVEPSIRIPTTLHPLKDANSSTTSVGIVRPLSQSSRSSSTSSLSTQGVNKSSRGYGSMEKKEQKFVDPLGVTLAAENADSTLLGTGNMLDITTGHPLSNSHYSGSSKLKESSSSRRDVITNTLVENEREEMNGKLDNGDAIDGPHFMTDFEQWSAKRTLILQKYTTNEKLSIVTSFLPGGIPLQTQIAVTDKLKHRLEQLDASDSSERRHSDLNQKEYVEKINELNRELMKAWREDQRVQAIKLVIQCAKLLSNTTAASHFYPSQFVLITDVLDTFGRLVYDRLYTKAISESPPAVANRLSKSKTNISHNAVPESTKETCRNWFYKIASIRELLPRFYVETCVLRSMRFIADAEEQRRCLVRLAAMVRGFSDPLVAAYARAYLCRVGMHVDAKFKDHIWCCFHDTMTTYERSLTKVKTADLYKPSLEWLLQCLTYDCTTFDIGPIFEYCRQKKSSLLLASCIKSIPSKMLVEGVESPLNWIRLIRECKQQKSINNNSGGRTMEDYERELLGEMIRSLGKSVINHEPPNPDDKLRLLNEAWKLFMRDTKVEFYLNCAQIWFEFACKHFGPREVNTLLEDIVKKCTSTGDKSIFNTIMDDRSISTNLFHILDKILHHLLPKHGPRALFDRTPQFIQFLDLLRADDARRRQACERVLASLGDYLPVAGVDDVELAGHVIQLCKTLHDGGLNEASSGYEEERRRLGRLICFILDRFDFCGNGDDFTLDGAQKQLEFLVDSRGHFCNLDHVQIYAVHRFNALALKAGGVRARTRKTAAFVRACIANSYITIPSIGGDHFIRLKLYLESSVASLFNNCLVQADALLKACISLILEVPPLIKASEFKQKSTEHGLLDFVRELMSLLLIVPDSPNGDVYLYLFEGLLNAVRRYPWLENSDGKFLLLLDALRFLSTSIQSEYPYKIESVESNDSLYGGDVRYVNSIKVSANAVVQELLDYLKKLDITNIQQKRRQTLLVLDFVECILEYGDMERDSLRTLCTNLWNLAKKNTSSGQDQERQTKMRSILVLVSEKARLGKSGGCWEIIRDKLQPF